MDYNIPAGPKESSFRPTQDLIVSVCGLGTSLAVALALAFIEYQWDFSVYSFTLWFVLPFGAGVSGVFGATGYYVAAKMLGHRPSKFLLANVLVASVATFFAVHYFEYRWLQFEGKPISDFVSFPRFLDLVIRSASMEFRVHASKVGGTGQMGVFGYIPAVIQIIGFAVGGFAVYSWLGTQPYCERCSRYLTGKGRQTRFMGDIEGFQAMAKRFAEHFQSGDLTSAIAEYAQSGQPKAQNKEPIQSSIELRHCPACTTHWLKSTAQRRDGSEWHEIAGVELQAYTETPLTLHKALV